MTMTDPIADFLTRLRNANSAYHDEVTLPHSKMRVRIPMYEYWTAVRGSVGKRRGTRPDHPVEARAADLLRGIDAPLELALELADSH